MLIGPLELNALRHGFANVPAAGALTSRQGRRPEIGKYSESWKLRSFRDPHRAFAAPGIIDPRLFASHEIGRF